MGTYSRELKEQLVKKLLVEGGPSVAALSRETGVGQSTLFAWKKRLREHGSLAAVASKPGSGANNRDQLAAVIATAAMNAVERSAYCREHGLHVEQVDTWRRAFETADLRSGSASRLELVHARQRVRALEKELRRKDRALAETAALLTLSKKVQALISAVCAKVGTESWRGRPFEALGLIDRPRARSPRQNLPHDARTVA